MLGGGMGKSLLRDNTRTRGCSTSSISDTEPAAVMRRLPSPLLKSLPLHSRRALFSNSARWTSALERVSSIPSGQVLDAPTNTTSLPVTESPKILPKKLPFRFDTGIALFAKRTPRPFPPPFLSPPSGSFSDPLSTHRQVFVNGDIIKGYTNGDDAVYASDNFIAANDGVGAWSTRPRGHAGLWSRLILHFWAVEVERDAVRERLPEEGEYRPNPVGYLQKAYEDTLEATQEPNDWHGTTTAAGAQLFYKKRENDGIIGSAPLLYVTNLGDSQILVVRPSSEEVVYKSKEQWHWFDCPRQLGTNSPDTPTENAVLDFVDIEEGDLVLAMSDGVTDNLWEHEIVENVLLSMRRWENGEAQVSGLEGGATGAMQFVAEQLMTAAKVIALDPFAESPFMEHAIEEGLPSHGGKLDDISVVAALCRKTLDD
ncbi:hypothetical protein MKZ38_000388 [Zalerion maritima]|uniref:Protein phosphatase n=1 Tax=Zalerion maritima TaxID=339359 RepID=A0AAD5RT50_9PEZI|nr:hypothetical protein MKZ38_000388 [Zalerion maritima]